MRNEKSLKVTTYTAKKTGSSPKKKNKSFFLNMENTDLIPGLPVLITNRKWTAAVTV